MAKKIVEVDAIIKEYTTEMGLRKDPWHRSETDGPDNEAGKAKGLEKENEIRQAREASTPDPVADSAKRLEDVIKAMEKQRADDRKWLLDNAR